MNTISSLSSDQQAVVYRSLFAKADANGNKSVSSEELGNTLSSIKSTLSQDNLDADEVFAGMDADDDGAVSRDEFTTGLSALVAQQSGSSTTTSASQTREEMIASFKAGIAANIASSLLGSSRGSSSYSSISDVVSMLKAQSGESTTTYSSSASTGSNASIVGALFSESA